MLLLISERRQIRSLYLGYEMPGCGCESVLHSCVIVLYICVIGVIYLHMFEFRTGKCCLLKADGSAQPAGWCPFAAEVSLL